MILKENNLRIFFNDTSASSSFPNVDWRLIANETSNGGANMFAIEIHQQHEAGLDSGQFPEQSPLSLVGQARWHQDRLACGRSACVQRQ
ncbi:hypothetical protein [Breoghania sp.]|uniref:hypothetical protein n=1 Tax=Breoghania sp. TaxID=2065378 RepID=UPI00262B069A|nr:hypothetical protein [Breoghania sp.]MDJ0933178.1 hypothetical protein [Breoghania sp.]